MLQQALGDGAPRALANVVIAVQHVLPEFFAKRALSVKPAVSFVTATFETVTHEEEPFLLFDDVFGSFRQ